MTYGDFITTAAPKGDVSVLKLIVQIVPTPEDVSANELLKPISEHSGATAPSYIGAMAPALESNVGESQAARIEPSVPVAIGVAIDPDGRQIMSASSQSSEASALRRNEVGYHVGFQPSAPPLELHTASQANGIGFISPDAHIDRHAKVGAGAVIGAGARLHGGCIVEDHARIGNGSDVHGGAHVCQHAIVGSNCKIHGGSRVGARATIGNGTEVHGGTNVGASATVGENCTIHGGARICERAYVGSFTTVHGGACVESNGMVEEQCTLHGGSHVHANTRLARSTTLHGGRHAFPDGTIGLL